MRRIVLCGPSCSGKTTIKQRLIQLGLKPSVSYTTRSPRENEIDAHDYHFISRERFEQLISEGFFFEYDDVFGDYYGTSLQDIANNTVFILTPKAVSKLRNSDFSYTTLIVQLTAPLETRIKRSHERGDSTAQILKRVIRDTKTFSLFNDHDICLNTNDNTEDEVIEIIERYNIQ